MSLPESEACALARQGRFPRLKVSPLPNVLNEGNHITIVRKHKRSEIVVARKGATLIETPMIAERTGKGIFAGMMIVEDMHFVPCKRE